VACSQVVQDGGGDVSELVDLLGREAVDDQAGLCAYGSRQNIEAA
jgi:hypothetical protein